MGITEERMEQITEISIKEISLSGFRNQKEPVSFALGDVNCVTGHNGTGKTTMAHGICYALYGVSYYGEQKRPPLHTRSHSRFTALHISESKRRIGLLTPKAQAAR